jgi:type II secretory pathway component PulJ
MPKKSFTLVEVLVAVGMFSIIVGTISGLFVSAISSQRKILATQELLDQVSYILEYMSRALRMAKKDDISIGEETKDCCLSGYKVNYCTSTGSDIIFRNYQNQCQRFYLSGNQIYEAKEGTSPLSLTSQFLKVNSLKFFLSGENQIDNLQPRVVIFLEIEGRGKNPPKIQIQTTISQRDLDVQY